MAGVARDRWKTCPGGFVLLQVMRDGLQCRSEAATLACGKTDQTSRGVTLLASRATEAVMDPKLPVFCLSASQIGWRVLAAGLTEGCGRLSMGWAWPRTKPGRVGAAGSDAGGKLAHVGRACLAHRGPRLQGAALWPSTTSVGGREPERENYTAGLFGLRSRPDRDQHTIPNRGQDGGRLPISYLEGRGRPGLPGERRDCQCGFPNVQGEPRPYGPSPTA